MASTRGLVVDDHTYMRAAMVDCLQQAGLEPVLDADTLAAAREIAAGPPVGLVVLDLRLPDGSALEIIPTLRATGARVLCFTSADDGYSVRSAYAAGASGYLLKSAAHDTVTHAVREVLAGRVYADPTVAALLVQGVQEAPKGDGTPLTRREISVLELVAEGLSNPEIAERLAIAPLSVKSHLARIGRKLGVGDRTQMVTAAMRAEVLR
ncbi:MAG: response regulator transcription factor [Mycobacteriales bacterium]|nr:response regulator transcription factor [Mycobacteriales bacterium]